MGRYRFDIAYCIRRTPAPASRSRLDGRSHRTSEPTDPAQRRQTLSDAIYAVVLAVVRDHVVRPSVSIERFATPAGARPDAGAPSAASHLVGARAAPGREPRWPTDHRGARRGASSLCTWGWPGAWGRGPNRAKGEREVADRGLDADQLPVTHARERCLLHHASALQHAASELGHTRGWLEPRRAALRDQAGSVTVDARTWVEPIDRRRLAAAGNGPPGELAAGVPRA